MNIERNVRGGGKEGGWKKCRFMIFFFSLSPFRAERKSCICYFVSSMSMISTIFTFSSLLFPLDIEIYLLRSIFYIIHPWREMTCNFLPSLPTNVYNYFFSSRNLKSTYHGARTLLTWNNTFARGGWYWGGKKKKKWKKNGQNLIEVEVAKNKVASTIFFFFFYSKHRVTVNNFIQWRAYMTKKIYISIITKLGIKTLIQTLCLCNYLK